MALNVDGIKMEMGMRKYTFLFLVIFLVVIVGMQSGTGAINPNAPFLPSGFSYLAGQYTFSDSEIQRYRRIDDDLVHYTDISPLTWYDGTDYVTDICGMELRTKPGEWWSYISETSEISTSGMTRYGQYLVLISDAKYDEFSHINIYNLETQEIVYSRKTAKEGYYIQVIYVYDDVLFLHIDDKTSIIDLASGELIEEIDAISNDEIDVAFGMIYIRDANLIFDVGEKRIVGSFELDTSSCFEFYEDYIEVYCDCYYEYPACTDGSTKKITRCDKFFVPFEEYNFPVEYNSDLYYIDTTYKHLAVCHFSVENQLQIIDMRTGGVLKRFDLNHEGFTRSTRKDENYILERNSGYLVINLDTLSITTQQVFPKNAEVLEIDGHTFQLRQFYSDEMELYYELFEIGADGKIMPCTRTVLGSTEQKIFMHDSATVVTIKPKTVYHIDSNHSETISHTLRFHKLGSNSPYKEVYLGKLCDSDDCDYFYQDGFIYVINPSFGIIKRGVFDTDYELIIGGTRWRQDFSAHYDLTFKYNQKHIIVTFRCRGDTWTKCFGLADGSLEYETAEYTQDFYVFSDVLIVDNTVIDTTNNKTFEFKGFPLYARDRVFYFSESDSISFMNLDTGEITSDKKTGCVEICDWRDLSEYGNEQNSFHKLGNHYSSNKAILDVTGTPLQKFPYPIDKTAVGNILFCREGRFNNAFASSLSPCPTFSIKRLDNPYPNKATFELIMTRDDRQANLLEGQAYLVGWDEKPKPYQTKLEYELAAPAYHKDLGERMSIGPLIPGMTTKITLSIPDRESVLTHSDLEKLASGDNNIQQDELKYFALVIESNGLLDVANSELSNIDTKGRPLFDGEIMSLDEQKAVVLTVWGINE